MIMDLLSSLTETKSSQRESSFPAGMPLIKLIGVANLQWPVIARKFLPLCHRDTRLGCVLTNTINQRRHSSTARFQSYHYQGDPGAFVPYPRG